MQPFRFTVSVFINHILNNWTQIKHSIALWKSKHRYQQNPFRGKNIINLLSKDTNIPLSQGRKYLPQICHNGLQTWFNKKELKYFNIHNTVWFTFQYYSYIRLRWTNGFQKCDDMWKTTAEHVTKPPHVPLMECVTFATDRISFDNKLCYMWSNVWVCTGLSRGGVVGSGSTNSHWRTISYIRLFHHILYWYQNSTAL